MGRNRVLFLFAAASIVLFAFAATADSLQTAFLFAVLGAVVPALGLAALALVRQRAWRRMGRELGLHPMERGAYPDLLGRVDGRRLVVARRADVYDPGRREITVVRLEGSPEIRLPGLVVRAQTVQDILAPLQEAS